MIVSDAQREANRRNSRLSTGPTTAAGKEASSRNAVRHGLTAERPVDAAEAAEHAARVASFRATFGPVDDWQSWLVEELAGATLRATRIARVEASLRAEAAQRAEHLWDEDRRVEAERVGATLARRPSLAVATLLGTPHGCEWMIARWEALAAADAWTPAQVDLARDLLGMPAESRPGPDDILAARHQFPDPAGLAREQVDRLRAQAAVMAEVDDFKRRQVAAGLVDTPTRDLANLRRYERAAVRRLEWVTDQMDRVNLRPQPQPQPLPQPQPAAPRAVAPALAPPAPPAEPTPPRVVDETKPPAALPAAPAAPEARPKRPDLDKFRRRNRRSA